MEIHLCSNCNSEPEFKDKPGGDPEVQLVCPVCGQKGKPASGDGGAVFMWNNNLIEAKGVSIFHMVTTLEDRIAKLEAKVRDMEETAKSTEFLKENPSKEAFIGDHFSGRLINGEYDDNSCDLAYEWEKHFFQVKGFHSDKTGGKYEG